jgi:glutathione S-transferase
MEYLSVAEARHLPGLRLVLTAGVPGPWGEAAKAVFKLRGVPFVPVEQKTMQPNEELLEWTGHRNAPIACLDDEPPLAGWLDKLLLAERIGSGPSLIPTDEIERAHCLGFSTELCGPDGFGWNRRHQVLKAYWGQLPGAEGPAYLVRTLRSYDVTEATLARSSSRIVAILNGLSTQLARQHQEGHDYLVGGRLSVVDLYWACFSMMVRPLRRELNPMPEWLWPLYGACDDEIDAALTPALLAHRDMIFERHIGVPLDF